MAMREDIVRDFLHSGNSSGLGFDGVARKGLQIRQGLRQTLFIKDEGAVDPDRRFQIHMHCGQRHPGLCSTLHAANYGDVLQLATSLERCLTSNLQHAYLRINDLEDQPHPKRVVLEDK